MTIGGPSELTFPCRTCGTDRRAQDAALYSPCTWHRLDLKKVEMKAACHAWWAAAVRTMERLALHAPCAVAHMTVAWPERSTSEQDQLSVCTTVRQRQQVKGRHTGTATGRAFTLTLLHHRCGWTAERAIDFRRYSHSFSTHSHSIQQLDGALSAELGGRSVPERPLRLIDEHTERRVAISEASAREPAH